MKHTMEKVFGNDRGFSCCFRQWSATHSHCSLLHGYSLGFKFVIGSETLDSRNWVFDFGNFGKIKQFLTNVFDHTFVIAKDDPHRKLFEELSLIHDPNKLKEIKEERQIKPHEIGKVMDLRILPNVGCEAFAKYVFQIVDVMITEMQLENNPKLLSVTVFEHGANSATYNGEQ